MPALANLSVRIAVVFLAALVYAGGHQTASLPEQALVVCEKEENRTTTDERHTERSGVLVQNYVVADLAVTANSRAGRVTDLFSANHRPKPSSTGPPII